MSDTNKIPGGEHMDELLSQLKSIFGNLSETEEQEAKQKLRPPPESLDATPTPLVPPDNPPPPSARNTADPKPATPIYSFDMPAPQMEEMGMPPQEMPRFPTAPPEPEPASPPLVEVAVPIVTPVNSFVASEVTVPTGSAIVPTAIFFPEGKLTEAKMVAEKVERITPKFTKVTFVLNVQMLNSYNQRADWKDVILKELQGSPIKAVLIMMDKPLDENRRKALQAVLEPSGIYLQEVLLNQMEKKALYTDMLLGMVFFFDSQKPASPDAT